MKARFAQCIGTRVSLRTNWKGQCTPQRGEYHEAKKPLFDSGERIEWLAEFGNNLDFQDQEWPTVCSYCGQTVLEGGKRSVIKDRLWDTPSGELEPGCLYFSEWQKQEWYWDNRKDEFCLYAVLPEGTHWNIDGRANNCTMPEEKTHRCWVRTGEPPNVHVDKNGFTCQAGAGSIQVPGYHGFLHHGEFHE